MSAFNIPVVLTPRSLRTVRRPLGSADAFTIDCGIPLNTVLRCFGCFPHHLHSYGMYWGNSLNMLYVQSFDLQWSNTTECFSLGYYTSAIFLTTFNRIRNFSEFSTLQMHFHTWITLIHSFEVLGSTAFAACTDHLSMTTIMHREKNTHHINTPPSWLWPNF